MSFYETTQLVGFLFVEGAGLFCWGGIKVDARLYGEILRDVSGYMVNGLLSFIIDPLVARSTTGVDGKWLEFVVH